MTPPEDKEIDDMCFKTLAITAILILMTAVFLTAQTTEVTVKLEKARLIERLEGDAVRAASLYREVAESSAATPTVRADAWLGLGLLERRLGKKDASTAALRKAAAGAGDAAQRAKEILAGKSVVDPRLAARVQSAIGRLHDAETADSGGVELQIVGGPAVPFLAVAIRAEQTDLAFVQRAVAALVSIGGPEAAAFLETVKESPDVLYRRMVAKALYVGAALSGGSEAMASSIATLVRDPDAQVAKDVVEALKDHTFSLEDAAYMFERADPSVLWEFVLNRSVPVHEDPEAMRRLAPVILESWRAGKVRESIAFFARTKQCLTTRPGLDLLLDVLPEITEEHLAHSPGTLRLGIPWEDCPTAMAMADYGRKLAPGGFVEVKTREGSPPGRVGVFASLVKNLRRVWGADETEGVVELLAQGIGDPKDSLGLEKWIIKTARPEDASKAARILTTVSKPIELARWMRKGKLDDTAVAPLVAVLEDMLAVGTGSVFGEIARILAGIGTPAAGEAMKAFVAAHPGTHPTFAYALSQNEARYSTDLLEHFAGMANETSGAQEARTVLAYPLLQRGAPSSIPVLVRIYGFGRTENASPLGQLSQILESAYTPEQLSEIFERSFVGRGKGEVWNDAHDLVTRSAGSKRSAPPQVLATIAKHAPEAPDDLRPVVVRYLIKSEEKRGILGAGSPMGRVRCELAKDPLSRVRANAVLAFKGELTGDDLKALESLLRDSVPYVVQNTLIRLRDQKLASLADAVAECLKNEDDGVRKTAIRVLPRFKEEKDIVDLFVPLLDDPTADVRLSVCSAFGGFSDRRVVPHLISTLRDPSGSVATAAREALERIQFYFDQKERWDRWAKGAGLNAGSAADALLEQIKPDRDKEIRLAALASLGTLAVPETLPVLIQLMTDKDADIAAAAAAAVRKINGK